VQRKNRLRDRAPEWNWSRDRDDEWIARVGPARKLDGALP
jgi:hypothetical protein